jgi:DNA (cytosine-5)-methyltransferase 1
VTLTAVSLFAGVGGFDLAMERAGIEVVADVEIDKAARSVLERRFPNSKHFNDITEVTGEQLLRAGFVPSRGVLTGGFPCQDLSVAGKRAGLAGKRSGLFWEIVRLLDELSPQAFVLENVPGLLSSHGGRDFGAVLGSLVERGYGVAYRILDAQYFGVAQRRRRVFIVGCLGDDGSAPGEILALAQGVSGDSPSGAEAGKEVAGTLTGGFGDRGVDADQIANGNYALANTLGTKRRHDLDQETYVARTLTARHDSSPDGDGGFNIVTVGALQARDSKGIGTTIDDKIIPVLLTMREGKDGGGKGPLVSEDVSLTLATGNGQVPIQPHVKIVRSGARDENGDLPAEVWAERQVAPTLNSMDNTGESRARVLVGGQTAVRRLTPLECERLQGFPPGWTAEGANGPQKDGPRYKQMGNALCVPVAEWIMKRLVEALG